MRTAPMAELVFENCALTRRRASWAAKDAAPRSSMPALEWERGAILAGIVGTMRRQLDRCVAHARSRKQFGQPIGKFQSVSNRIVDMTVRLETAGYMVYRYAWAKRTARMPRSGRRWPNSMCPKALCRTAWTPFASSVPRGSCPRDRARARSARQRRRRDLLGHERHSAQPHRPVPSPWLKPPPAIFSAWFRSRVSGVSTHCRVSLRERISFRGAKRDNEPRRATAPASRNCNLHLNRAIFSAPNCC